MARRRFEELPVWRAAIDLAVGILALTKTGCLNGIGDLRNQIERAVLSVSNNIAEGWERGTNEELITFLYYARGSCGEVRSMLRLVARLELTTSEEVGSLIDRCVNTSVQLGAWLESLKNSENQGQRFWNDATRSAEHQKSRRVAFQEQLREIQEKAKQQPLPKPSPKAPEQF